MSEWINFKKLRAKLDFRSVLKSYGVEIKAKGDQHHGFCPLPTHQGKRNSASFSAHLAKGIFQCFGCGAKGNTLDFAVRMEGMNPDDGESFKKGTMAVATRFGLVVPTPSDGQSKPKVACSPKESPEEANAGDMPVVVNAPLDFELKRLDPDHPYLPGRGFTKETIKEFCLGFCSNGFFKDRVVIPLHDSNSKLVGYCGRVVDDSKITEENPRYRFPPKRERKGVIYEFRKSEFLYGGYRIKKPVSDLIIVEGFASIWWLWQGGIRNAVGLMGWSCSEKQAELIVGLVGPDGRVWLMPDGDEAGRRCADTVLQQVSQHRFFRWVKLSEGRQPTDYEPDELKRMLLEHSSCDALNR